MDVVGGYLDLREWVRYVAAENFVSEKDGMLGDWGVNNFYLYRLEQQNVSRVIAWDKDNAFNRADLPIWAGVVDNVLMRRAMAVPELRELYLNTLLEAASVASAPVDSAPDGGARLPGSNPRSTARSTRSRTGSGRTLSSRSRMKHSTARSNACGGSRVSAARSWSAKSPTRETSIARRQPCTLPVDAAPASTR